MKVRSELKKKKEKKKPFVGYQQWWKIGDGNTMIPRKTMEAQKERVKFGRVQIEKRGR